PLDSRPRAVRASMRCAAAVFETRLARLSSERNPLVSGRSSDPVPLAELGHRPLPALEIANESEPLFQDIRFHARHLRGVNDVPGLLLTMNPDRTPTPPNPPLDRTGAQPVRHDRTSVRADRSTVGRYAPLPLEWAPEMPEANVG